MVPRKIAVTAIVALVALAGVVTQPAAAGASTVPPLDHVFVIMMENHSYSEVIGSPSAPYINNLARSGALAMSYFGVAHPSLPNYLAVTGGSTFGVTSDCTTCWQPYNHIGDLLETAHKTWKAYEESMPSACFVGDSYPYAQKHDPFIYYSDVRTNASRCQGHVVPYSQLAGDLASTSTTPNFAFITPNMCNDMHDCSVSTGDSWLQHQVPAILGSAAFTQQRSLLVVTWDEDDSSGTNQVATIFAGPAAKSGVTSAATYNHYSLLHTIELALGVGTLTSNDANAATIGDMFAAPTTTPTPCASVTSSASPASPQMAGTVATVSAKASGCPNPQYEFWIKAPGATMYTLAQSYGSSPTLSWATSGAAPGTYRIAVWVRDAGSAGVYSNDWGSWDAYDASLYYTLTAGCPSVSVAASPPGAAMAGMAVPLTANSPGCAHPEYEFWILAPGASLYTLAQPYSTSATLQWKTSGLAPGVYRVDVWVRDSTSAGVSSNAWGTWDAYDASLRYTITAGCPSVTESASTTAAVSSTLTVAATAAGCSDPEYEFWVLAPGANLYVLAQPYGPSSTFSWSTVGLGRGTYRITVWVRQAGTAGTFSNPWGGWDAYDGSLYIGLN